MIQATPEQIILCHAWDVIRRSEKIEVPDLDKNYRQYIKVGQYHMLERVVAHFYYLRQTTTMVATLAQDLHTDVWRITIPGNFSPGETGTVRDCLDWYFNVRPYIKELQEVLLQ